MRRRLPDLQTGESNQRLARGIGRSLRIYYGEPGHSVRLTALYGRFIRPGRPVFDIGAHVGDRIMAFRRLGCTVTALEPQPAAFRALQLIYGRDAKVRLIQAAASDTAGTLTLQINSRNPTVSTASAQFIAAAQSGVESWRGQTWDQVREVQAVTLDGLIEAYGAPAFVKIDVEGYEHKVLAGLSCPLPALSFEFTLIQREVAIACINRLSQLGSYRFNAALGESQQFHFPEAVHRDELLPWLTALPMEANSGDIYAFLQTSRVPASVL